MKKFVVFSWNFIFNHDKSPLRHIPDMQVRHMVLQLLGWMWALSFGIALGSYTILAASMVGHIVLIGAAAITVATYTVATTRPRMFLARARR